MGRISPSVPSRLYQQIVDGVRRAVNQRRLESGSAPPWFRVLAGALLERGAAAGHTVLLPLTLRFGYRTWTMMPVMMRLIGSRLTATRKAVFCDEKNHHNHANTHRQGFTL